MLIYKDVITGDNLFSDQYPFKEVGDAVYEVSLISVDGEYLVEEFNLQHACSHGDEFLAHFQGYREVLAELLAEKDPELALDFREHSMSYITESMDEIKYSDFYTGSSGNKKGLVIMVRDGDVALFWKHGVQPSES